jgi:hypothetical protein
MKALPWGLFISIQIPPNRYLPLEMPEGPAAATSIQNGSSRLLISQDFLPRSVPNRHLRDTLGSKGFFRTSVPNIALSRP